MIILGIDPGIGRVGWSLIEEISGKQALIDYGCLETPSTDPEEVRLEKIHAFFSELINSRAPDTLSIEQLFFSTNAKTAFSVGQARGVIILTAKQANIPITSYTPLQIKQSICNYGKADKRQIQLMVKTLLKLPSIPHPDDAADALAIALTHAFSYKLQTSLRTRGNGKEASNVRGV